MYEDGPISSWPTKEKRKYLKNGVLFVNIFSFQLDEIVPEILQLI